MITANDLKLCDDVRNNLQLEYEFAKVSYEFYSALNAGETSIFLIAPEESLNHFIDAVECKGFIVTQGEDKTNCTVTFR